MKHTIEEKRRERRGQGEMEKEGFVKSA